MYYNSKIDLFFTLGATSSGPVVWLTWLENMRRPHVVKLYPYLRGNRPFILPESLSIWKWENGKITLWWKEPLKSWGGKELRKCLSIYQFTGIFFNLIYPGNACWLYMLFWLCMLLNILCSYCFYQSRCWILQSLQSRPNTVYHNELTRTERYSFLLPEFVGHSWYILFSQACNPMCTSQFPTCVICTRYLQSDCYQLNQLKSHCKV